MSKKSVMLVDDSAMVQLVVRRLLQEDKRLEVVQTAGDGGHALELLRSETLPDLVILDLQMPGSDGFTVLSKVPAHVKERILILSSANEELLDRARAYDVEVLRKPAGVITQLQGSHELDLLRGAIYRKLGLMPPE